MRILIIAHGFPSKRDPQWGCFERDQALALKQAGHDVSIMYVDLRFRTYWRKIGVSHKTESNIDIYGVFFTPTNGLVNIIGCKYYYSFISKFYDMAFRKYVKGHGMPDLIYAHFLWNIAYGAYLKRRYKIPLVGIEHWSGMTQKKLRPVDLYRGNVGYNNTEKLLVVSKSLQMHIFRHFNLHSDVVYDMLGQEFVSFDIKKWERVTKKVNLSDDNFVFVSIGSLIHRKGFDLLLSAFSKIIYLNNRFRLIIVGDGPERNEIEKQIAELELVGCVELVGRKTKREIIEIMSRSHVFVLSSRAETFGVVCIEAMSQGLPIISTICGGPEEFVIEDNGILVPAEDIDALAAAMKHIYDNYSQYDPISIVKYCRQHFAPQIIANQLTEIFNKVVVKQ